MILWHVSWLANLGNVSPLLPLLGMKIHLLHQNLYSSFVFSAVNVWKKQSQVDLHLSHIKSVVLLLVVCALTHGFNLTWNYGYRFSCHIINLTRLQTKLIYSYQGLLRVVVTSPAFDRNQLHPCHMQMHIMQMNAGEFCKKAGGHILLIQSNELVIHILVILHFTAV